MSKDPSIHRHRQDEFIAHVRQLLDDERLRIDTAAGRRPVTTFYRDINFSDHAVDLKRLMSETGNPNRDLERCMPEGREMEALLSRRLLLAFKRPVARLRVICLSPDRALLEGTDPAPMETADVQRALSHVPPSLPGVPTTLVVMSTSGFNMATHELAERTAERTVVLVEPNSAGGWTVHAPAETQELADLFDPEQDQQKRQRIKDAIEAAAMELSASGITANYLASTTRLPLRMIEPELKAYAKEDPSLTTKRLDGQLVLFRQGTTPLSPHSTATGGSDMPFIDRIRSLFARKGDAEKKIAFLSERRTLLSRQRDRAYEEIGNLEIRDGELRDQFKAAATSLTKKRITGQLLQLRKDMERRQQMLSVLNQQINIIGTHLHNIELVRQGETAQLPDGDELAADAAAAEEMIAGLEAGTELAGSLSAGGEIGGLTAEEQALYDELERETATPGAAPAPAESTGTAGAQKAPSPDTAEPAASPRRTGEAEAE